MRTLLLLLAFAVSGLVQAQVYKFVDADGVVHYTNIKPRGIDDLIVINFPCYASNPECRQIDWERVALNTDAYQREISAAAASFAVDEALLRAIIHAESAYRHDAVSPKGAQGLMQLMPATQDQYGVTDPFDPEQNVQAGSRHLSELLAALDGDRELAAAAYNAGMGAVQRHDGVPPYRETQDYVKRVAILYRRYSDG